MNKVRNKKRILIFSEYYLPGYKSGGGMRTIVNIVSNLKDKFDFFIVTKDLDGKSDLTPYENIDYENWNDVQGAKVFYLSKKNINAKVILKLFNEVDPDILYSNSYFSVFGRQLLLLNKLSRLKNLPYIISPCGELSEDSFRMGKVKKNLFVSSAKLLKLHGNIIWKASTDVEKRQIENILGKNERIVIAPDLIPKVFLENFSLDEKPLKTAGNVNLIFLSRFNKKKNFKFLLENLFQIKGNVEIDMIGPIDDEKYWQECAEVIKTLPSNIKVTKKEPIPHPKVVETLKQYHFFVLPTQHENFGHIFLEALSAGCPILISDRTPWLELEKENVGWSIPLENTSEWRKALQKCVDIDGESYLAMSETSRKFVERWILENDLKKETLELFDLALSNT